MLKLILPLLAVACGCAATSPSPMDSLPPDHNRMKADHLPTPFSAKEIRSACSEGAYREFEITGGDSKQRMRMVFGPEVNGEAVVTTIMIADDGSERTAGEAPPSPWESFQSHASFPAAQTELSTTRHGTRAGTFDCWSYAVTGPDGSETTFVFARDLAGPPLDMTTHKGGELVQRMELIGYGRR